MTRYEVFPVFLQDLPEVDLPFAGETLTHTAVDNCRRRTRWFGGRSASLRGPTCSG